jgi:ZU5 domain
MPTFHFASAFACALVVMASAGGCSEDNSGGSSGTSTSSGGSSSGGSSTSSSSSSSGGVDSGTDAGGTGGTSIGPAGGTVTHPSGAKLVVPAGALAAATVITITEGPVSAARPENWRKWITKSYLFEPTGTTFTKPVTVTLPYDSALLPSNVQAYRVMTSTPAAPTVYTSLGAVTVDATAKTLTASMSSFSGKDGEVECGPPDSEPMPCQ